MTATTGPTCDRCGAGIALTGYRWTKSEGGNIKRELLLCAHHSQEHDPTLSKQGWWCERITPPEPEAVSDKIPGTCKTCGGAQFHRFVKATPEAKAVRITQCKTCDTRTCGYALGKRPDGELVKCDSRAMKHDDTLCPKGHVLMEGIEK